MEKTLTVESLTESNPLFRRFLVEDNPFIRDLESLLLHTPDLLGFLDEVGIRKPEPVRDFRNALQAALTGFSIQSKIDKTNSDQVVITGYTLKQVLDEALEDLYSPETGIITQRNKPPRPDFMVLERTSLGWEIDAMGKCTAAESPSNDFFRLLHGARETLRVFTYATAYFRNDQINAGETKNIQMVAGVLQGCEVDCFTNLLRSRYGYKHQVEECPMSVTGDFLRLANHLHAEYTTKALSGDL